jgi:anti-sigma regulatory factor (Ser/Thr protein kinase)
MNSGTALRHHALVYESDDEYVARTAAFLSEGLEAGEACVLGDTRDGAAMVREALGSDADNVAFFDIAPVYTRPAHAVATYFRTFTEQLRNAPSVRAVASGQFAITPGDSAEWTSYEAITNLAYSHLPVWVVCAYDASRLPDSLVEAVLRTHPEVLGDSCQMSDHYEDPRELVRELTPQPEPLPKLRSLPPMDSVELFREQLAREIAAEGVPEARALQMLVAASEVASNALTHGEGIAEVRVGRAYGRLVCDVIDRGRGFDDPMAGYMVPREGIARGLWIARQLSWEIEHFDSPRGFTVRIWF